MVLINKFEVIYKLGSGNLRTYEQNIKLLREKIDDPSFEKELQQLNLEVLRLSKKVLS